MKPRSPRQLRTRAFSLVEVVLALAVVSIGIVSIVALLPLGSISISNSRMQAAAATAAEDLGSSLNNAFYNNGSYSSVGLWTNQLVWTLGGGTVKTTVGLTADGQPTNSWDAAGAADQRMVSEITLTPPSANRVQPGYAVMSVAWPGSAKWNAGTVSWQNAQGSNTYWIEFMPK